MTSAVDETNALQRAIVSDQRRQLLDLASDYSNSGVAPDVVVAVGDPGYEIARRVVQGGHDLLIKTAEGVVLFNREVESFSQSLLRLCPCPVWLLKPGLRGQLSCVVAAVDASMDGIDNRDLNRRILEHASQFAKRESAALHVVSVWNNGMETPLRIKMGDRIVDVMTTEYESQLRGHLDDLLSDINLQVHEICRHVHRGNAVEAIRKAVEQVNADLVVMSLPCRTGISGLLIGNTAELVLNDSECSVFAIKPDSFVSPVKGEPRKAGIRWDAASEYSFRT
ncbi:MAG: universal stress protein [Planctomycetales bacterium]|nr:universal stress protein [Planctomycetales bacterium]